MYKSRMTLTIYFQTLCTNTLTVSYWRLLFFCVFFSTPNLACFHLEQRREVERCVRPGYFWDRFYILGHSKRTRLRDDDGSTRLKSSFSRRCGQNTSPQLWWFLRSLWPIEWPIEWTIIGPMVRPTVRFIVRLMGCICCWTFNDVTASGMWQAAFVVYCPRVDGVLK